MDLRFLLLIFALIYFVSLSMAAPVDQKAPAKVPIPGAGENEIEENVVEGVGEDKKVDGELDELGLEYGRYLQEVVKALDEDPEFSKKLENITHDQIMSGHVARHIETVAPDVRNRLDELKRIELDRLRKLAMKEHNLEEQIAREQAQNGGTGGDDDKNAPHVDHQNPHTFEAEDLQRLIMQATHDLEELDRKRRRDFKQYEMEKEIHYRDTLTNMTEPEKAAAEKKHQEEKQQKAAQHAKVNHPGSKHQFEEVWEQQDHMQKQEFDPKIFFQMHDVNGDGFLDQEEVEALLSIEVRKMYNEKDPAFDKNEMIEEYHRMREHIYKEIDANHDGLISKKEFIDYTKSPEYEKDEGWKGVEEAPVYTEEELKHYEQQRQALQQHYEKYGAYQMPYGQGMDPMMAGYGQQPHGYGQQGAYYYPQDPNYHPQMGGPQMHPGDPNYHPQMMGQQHPGQQQYAYHMPPEHIQQPVQVHHVEMPPQHYVNGVPQQQQYGQQPQYGQLPPAGQHPSQQQQYMAPNPNIAQLPPSSQQHPAQQQQHPGMGQPQQQGYQQPQQQQVVYQVHPGQPLQGQQPPPQVYQAQPPHPGQQQPPPQQQYHAAVPPAPIQNQQQQAPNAVPNSPPQQQQQPNPGQHH